MVLKMKYKKVLTTILSITVSAVTGYILSLYVITHAVVKFLSNETVPGIFVQNRYFYTLDLLGIILFSAAIGIFLYQKILPILSKDFLKFSKLTFGIGLCLMLATLCLPYTLFTDTHIIQNGVFSERIETQYTSIKTADIQASISRYRNGKRQNSCRIHYDLIIPAISPRPIRIDVRSKMPDIKNILEGHGILVQIHVSIDDRCRGMRYFTSLEDTIRTQLNVVW